MHLQLSSYKDAILAHLNEGGRNGGAHHNPMGNGTTMTLGGKDSMSMLTLSDSERPSLHDNAAMHHQTQNHNSVRRRSELSQQRFFRA